MDVDKKSGSRKRGYLFAIKKVAGELAKEEKRGVPCAVAVISKQGKGQ